MSTPADPVPPDAGLEAERPGLVVVDLDGTLLRGDLLWEGLRMLLRDRPFELLWRAPGWLAGGKAAFKAAVAARVRPDPRTLPYRRSVLDHLAEARRAGARIVLASASPRPWVEAVAAELGLFDAVLASSPTHNLSGEVKLEAIRAEAGGGQFEYLGNDAVDVPIWRAAARATAVAPTTGARRGLRTLPDHAELAERSPSVARAVVRQLRPHQWAKNALVFVPIALAHQLADPVRLGAVIAAFVAFCAVASAGYVLNDLVDVDADRAHPTKRRRPIAGGALPIPAALALLVALLAAAAAVSALGLSPGAAGMVAAYLVLTLSYSFYFKRRLLLDVLLLAGLYTHRVLAGGVAADVAVSPWLLAFSTFFFLSLALVKRYVEFSGVARAAGRRGDRAGDRTPAPPEPAEETTRRRAYQVGDLGLIQSLGVACACIAVLVLCLFVSSDHVTRLYSTPDWLWLMCPIMFYWIARIWLLAHRGELDEDPVLFATQDPNSWVAGALVAAILAVATWW